MPTYLYFPTPIWSPRGGYTIEKELLLCIYASRIDV